MADFVPMVRPLRGKLFLLALLPMLLLIGVSTITTGDSLYGGIALWIYLIVVHSCRHWLLRHHKRGIRLMKQQQWAAGIPEFEKSYEQFERHPAIDRYRWLILSASPMHFREMALLNIGFCLAQLGRRAESQAMYERVLREYPGSPMAITTLNFMRDASAPSDTDTPG
jgi:tetratricopeptide (TPR) repeat protein